MKSLLLAIILALWPAFVLSAPIPVRTGEHADFTRVVLRIPAGLAWDFAPSQEGFVLRLPTTEGFALRRFFDLIPKTRIAAVEQRPQLGELEFVMACRCDATPELFAPDLLVIDFATLPDAAGDDISDAGQDIATSTPELAGRRFTTSINGILPLFPEEVPVGPARPVAEDAPEERRADQTEIAVTQSTEKIIRVFEAQVAQAMGEGLSGALLTGSLPTDAPNIATAPDSTLSALPGIRAVTSVDPRALPATASSLPADDAFTCLPETHFNVPSWGDERPFEAQISETRAMVLGEFDRPSADRVTALARLYTYFGFGHEAVQTLTLDDARSQERRYLTVIAMTLDGEDVQDAGLEGQESCPSAVALWTVLVDHDRRKLRNIATDAVLNSFRALPVHLRDVVAPKLAQIFLDVGDADAAKQVLDRLQDANASPSETAMARSELSFAMGDAEVAMDLISDVVAANTRATPALLIRFFEDGIAAERIFSNADFALSDAIRFEVQDTPDHEALTVAQFRAHLAVGQFGQAQDMLDRDAALLPEPVSQGLARLFLETAITDMEDGAFGKMIWQRSSQDVPDDLRNAIALRLAEMGFVDRARQFDANVGATDSAPIVVPDGDTISDVADPATPIGAIATAEVTRIEDSQLLLQELAARRAQLNVELSAIVSPDALD